MDDDHEDSPREDPIKGILKDALKMFADMAPGKQRLVQVTKIAELKRTPLAELGDRNPISGSRVVVRTMDGPERWNPCDPTRIVKPDHCFYNMEQDKDGTIVYGMGIDGLMAIKVAESIEEIQVKAGLSIS